jgi:hypothetical protein
MQDTVDVEDALASQDWLDGVVGRAKLARLWWRW